MKILRYIFGVLLLLFGLGAGGITYLLHFDPEFSRINVSLTRAMNISVAGYGISAGGIAIAVTVVLVVLALMVLPIGGGRSRALKKGKEQAKKTQAARERLKEEREAKRKSLKQPATMSLPPAGAAGKDAPASAAQAAKQARDAKAAGEEEIADPRDREIPPDLDDDEDDTARSAADAALMEKLVVMEQGEISREILTDLLKEYYPDALDLVDCIEKDDNLTLDRIGRQVLLLARNKIKLNDKTLTDNQFSIFQSKVFDGERETLAQIYLPPADIELSKEQQDFRGMIVESRAWDGVQRRVRGERDHWHELSLANAKQLLG